MERRCWAEARLALLVEVPEVRPSSERLAVIDAGLGQALGSEAFNADKLEPMDSDSRQLARLSGERGSSLILFAARVDQ